MCFQVSIRGLTGDVRLDRHGRRDTFSFDVLELNRSSEFWSYRKSVVWEPTSGLMKPKGEEVVVDKEFSVDGLTLRVVTTPVSRLVQIWESTSFRFVGIKFELR